MVASKKRAPIAATAPSGPERSEGDAVDLEFLETIIGYSMRRAQATIYADYARTVGEVGIRPAQFAAMVIIAANPGLTQSALAATMGIDRSAAVGLIDGLEAGQWVERVPSSSDRRSYSIMITEIGRTMLARLKQLVREHDQRMGERLSPAERAMLMELLHRLY
jgi:DNA-binding MarR family transcriptional regulator